VQRSGAVFPTRLRASGRCDLISEGIATAKTQMNANADSIYKLGLAAERQHILACC
jgi:hypothetical protein